MYENLQPHELASIWPSLEKKDQITLQDSIIKKGLRQRIVLYEGKILDGRNRYDACKAVGLQFTDQHFTEFKPTEKLSALEYVIIQNDVRRHLSASQRAAMAVPLKKRFDQEGRKRRLENIKPLESCTSNFAPSEGRSDERAAKTMGVSARSVQTAGHIADNFPALFNKVQNGEVTLSGAMRAAASPAPQIAKPKPPAADRLQQFNDEHKIVRDLRGKLKDVLDEFLAIPMKIRIRCSEQSISAHINTCRHELLSSAPAYLCPYCNANGCKACDSVGWITETQWKFVPHEVRERAIKNQKVSAA